EIEMVKIPAGSFMMGSDNGDSDEKPVHRVNISKSFYMGKYEVKQAQWKAVMGNNPSRFSDCGGDCPVEQVSWEDVQDFLKLLNRKGEGTYRLPTEAEWEYAARAGSTTKYSYGNGESSLETYAWYGANSGNKTHPVGQKEANDFGLYDMSGNVWEWCQDWYGSYSGGTVTNPTGATSGYLRVRRGGSWNLDAAVLRSADRDGYAPWYHSYDLGFRVVRN
ncbi:MAG: formylglycine-generating enzyme family protein, partial [Pyrinomonadaceae bacterium]|nr:formylglycine-generating enzyme family protein [Pyrinomonadaceae bacterium]